MSNSFFLGALVFTLSCASGLLAQTADSDSQQTPTQTPTLSQDPSVAPPAYVPLTWKERYWYSVDQIFSVPTVATILVRSSFDQGMNTPSGWGTGPGGFGERVASHFGRAFVHENVAFAIRAIDKEDPRYFVLGRGTAWTRVKYAAKATFVVRRDNGDMIPAYSRFISDYSMPFIAQTWRPEGVHSGREFRSGTISLGTGVVNNVFREFWPDLKRKLHQ
jgi:hypothetical protein